MKAKGSGNKVTAAEQAELTRMAEEDAQQEPVSPDKLAIIVSTAHQLQRLERSITEAQGVLERLTKEKQRLEFMVLPGLMDESRLKDFTLDDGWKVLREDAVYASISKDNAPVACEWLNKNGYGDIVKTMFTIPVPKGPEAPAAVKSLRALLAKHKVVFAYTSAVHPQTLKAFVKESIEKSRKLTPAITVHQQPCVSLKAPKG